MSMNNLREEARKNTGAIAYLKQKEYLIPTRLYSTLMMRAYKDISWQTVVTLFRNCVDLIKTSHEVEFLIDIPFGVGYVEVQSLFFKELEKIRVRKLQV